MPLAAPDALVLLSYMVSCTVLSRFFWTIAAVESPSSASGWISRLRSVCDPEDVLEASCDVVVPEPLVCGPLSCTAVASSTDRVTMVAAHTTPSTAITAAAAFFFFFGGLPSPAGEGVVCQP